jgi:hypothetical protein
VTAANGSSVGIREGSELVLGGTVRFITNAKGLKGSEWPMVLVKCVDDKDDVIYAQLDHPDPGFVLGDGSSEWRSRGGPADCSATLLAYGGRSGGMDTIRTLAGPVTFHAEA